MTLQLLTLSNWREYFPKLTMLLFTDKQVPNKEIYHLFYDENIYP